MPNNPIPPRRVVVGNGPDGKSKVLSDSQNPHQHERGGGSTIFAGIAPFFVADVFRLILLIMFPALALWLPGFLG